MANQVFVLSLSNEGINFGPETEQKEILQNVRTIISTTKYSVPLDRGFGVDATFLDQPMAVAQASISSEILRAVKQYEPRVTITGISFDGDPDGRLLPKVEVVINETE